MDLAMETLDDLVAQRGGYRFEQVLPRHCRTWTHTDVEHDTWRDCMIWSQVTR
jgi:hypothetical protein